MRPTGRVEVPRLGSGRMPDVGGGLSPSGEVRREPLPIRANVGSSGVAVDVGGVLTHPVGAVPRRGRLRAALVTIRPRQWIKNGLVVAAAGAAGALGHDGVPVRVGLACVAFCMLASGIYAINDVRDA
jgi:hypothetical protein